MIYKGRSNCGNLNLADVGREVQMAGWVDALRDHKEVLFIHLRDRSGIVQVVFSPEATPTATCQLYASLRGEFCVSVRGRVVERARGTENPSLETGRIEVLATDLAILSRSDPLPFPISEKAMLGGSGGKGADPVAEDVRLQYRYLDLRRPSMQEHLIQRHRISQCVRDFLDDVPGWRLDEQTTTLPQWGPKLSDWRDGGFRARLIRSEAHP